MKKIVLVIPFLILVNTSVYSIEISSDDEKKVFSSKQDELTPDELQERIDKFKKYLSNLPIKIQNTIGELKEYKSKGIEAENMVKNLLVNLDKCATRELDDIAKLACSSVSDGRVSRTIKAYKRQIVNAINFVDKKLKELRVKEGNADIINDSIKSLENARDILMRKV
jgi:hypothetical protein